MPAGPGLPISWPNVTRMNSTEQVRLVRGSHIVTKRLFDHEKCYFFQGLGRADHLRHSL